jgi:hypothetical protein
MGSREIARLLRLGPPGVAMGGQEFAGWCGPDT